MKKILGYSLFLLLAACLNPPTPPAGTATKPETTLATDSFYCYIRKVYAKNGKALLDVDRIEFLTGQAAVQRARKEGHGIMEINPAGDTIWSIPDDYYIVNPDNTIETVEVNPDVTILLNPLDGDITRMIGGKLPDLTVGRITSFPYLLRLRHNKVFRIWEQFIP